jgi:CBS domain-containing protein
VLTAQSCLGDLPLRPAVGTDRSCTLVAAVEAMERAGVSSLLVDRDGIVTERDIARALAHGCPTDVPVASVASWHPIIVTPDTTVVTAAAMMLNEHVRHLLVESEEQVAVVSLRDVTAVLLQAANPDLWLTSLRIAVDTPAEAWLG